MSDLISRSEVIQILKECNLDETLFEKDVFDKINNLPTAYDMDKVVEELEELADNSNDHMYESYFDGKEDGIREAIEIVKQGGVRKET